VALVSVAIILTKNRPITPLRVWQYSGWKYWTSFSRNSTEWV